MSGRWTTEKIGYDYLRALRCRDDETHLYVLQPSVVNSRLRLRSSNSFQEESKMGFCKFSGVLQTVSACFSRGFEISTLGPEDYASVLD